MTDNDLHPQEREQPTQAEREAANLSYLFGYSSERAALVVEEFDNDY